MGCNTEAATPPQPLHWKPFNSDLLYFYSMPRTCSRPSQQVLITNSCLLTCFDVGSGIPVDHSSGGGRRCAGFIYYYGERVLGQLLPNNTYMEAPFRADCQSLFVLSGCLLPNYYSSLLREGHTPPFPSKPFFILTGVLLFFLDNSSISVTSCACRLI